MCAEIEVIFLLDDGLLATAHGALYFFRCDFFFHALKEKVKVAFSIESATFTFE